MRCTHLGLPDKAFLIAGSIGFPGASAIVDLTIATDGAGHYAYSDGVYQGGTGIAVPLGAISNQQWGPIKISTLSFTNDGRVLANFYPYGNSGHPVPPYLVPQITIINGPVSYVLTNPFTYVVEAGGSAQYQFHGQLPQRAAQYRLRWTIPPYPVVLPSGGGNVLTLTAGQLGSSSILGFSSGLLDNSPPAGGALAPTNFGAASFGCIDDAHSGPRFTLFLIAGEINGAPPAQNIWTSVSFNDSLGNPQTYLSANANYSTNADNSANWSFLRLFGGVQSFVNGQNTQLTFT